MVLSCAVDKMYFELGENCTCWLVIPEDKLQTNRGRGRNIPNSIVPFCQRFQTLSICGVPNAATEERVLYKRNDLEHEKRYLHESIQGT